jgi:hypothetical protein
MPPAGHRSAQLRAPAEGWGAMSRFQKRPSRLRLDQTSKGTNKGLLQLSARNPTRKSATGKGHCLNFFAEQSRPTASGLAPVCGEEGTYGRADLAGLALRRRAASEWPRSAGSTGSAKPRSTFGRRSIRDWAERVARAPQLREENSKLKHLVADLSLDRHILQEIVQKKL